MPGRTRKPLSTYRLQLGGDMDFAAAAGLVDYLAALGVSHLYLSPIMEARPGSSHGYDVADPSAVSTVLGGEEGLRRLAQTAHDHGLGLVCDLVPNHLGTGWHTPLWRELLAQGRTGPGARVFDVDWDHPLPGAAGKVVIPVLGDQYGAVLASGELWVEEADSRLRLRYHEQAFPLAPRSEELIAEAGGLDQLHGTPGDADSWARLHRLLEAQHYRLVFWRAGQSLVNYRRFFSIDDLAGVRVEDPEVFELVHAKACELVAEGVVDGLRIDHPDGLRDPGRYFAELADATGGVWTVAEKILDPGEALPDWQVAGTTGYDFANDVLGLFVDPAAEETLNEVDRAFAAPAASYAEQARDAKLELADGELAADRNRLGRLLWTVAQQHPEARDVDEDACRRVVSAVVASLPVYRTYVDPDTGEPRDEDVTLVREAVADARQRNEATLAPLFSVFERSVLGREDDDAAHRELRARFPQLSAAVTAKGVEDTVFYRYRRLVALNEVGGDPARLGLEPADYHERMRQRAGRHPAGMTATATHDTKRGEDVRLRIAALSELADEWRQALLRWRELNRHLIVATPRGPAPDAQTELLTYQTLVGVWPVVGGADPELVQRVQDYLIKAAREAKERTTWTEPDSDFEEATRAFVAALCDSEVAGEFVAELRAFAERSAEVAVVSGLAQTLLRIAGPGVPDTYQGTELWDDSLVDPDNRRPVAFGRRRELLAELDAGAEPGRLLASRHDGRLKLWVLSRALRARAAHPDCFGPDGEYRPLQVSGAWRDHVVAFARTGEDGRAAVVVAPRLPGSVMADKAHPPTGEDWKDTTLDIPSDLQGRWSSALTAEVHEVGDRLGLGESLGTLPVALLIRD